VPRAIVSTWTISPRISKVIRNG